MTFRPMLAVTLKDLKLLRYPVLASPKLDGIRAIIRNGCVLSRSLKPIPNAVVQSKYNNLEGYDGELIIGASNAKDCYLKTVSGIMTQGFNPGGNLSFVVFDNVSNPCLPFKIRNESVESAYRLPHKFIHSEQELLLYEESILHEGFEGLILRDPSAPYKYGRSTPRERGMVKLKRFKDDEATVVAFEELYSNQNEATQSELGYTDRSSHQINMVRMNTLGSLIVLWKGFSFRIGTGFSADQRRDIWAIADTYIGKTVKFKYMESGMKNLPRHPVFLGWRDERDK
jgi:DNA ligase-1